MSVSLVGIVAELEKLKKAKKKIFEGPNVLAH